LILPLLNDVLAVSHTGGYQMPGSRR